MLANSFIFGRKGFIRLQKTNIKDENSVHNAVGCPLLDWQLLTPETTFGLQANKVGGITFWTQISQMFLPLSLSLFSSLFFLALFLPATLHYPNTWNRLSPQSVLWAFVYCNVYYPGRYTRESFKKQGFTTRSRFYKPLSIEKVPLSYTFFWQMVPLPHT